MQMPEETHHRVSRWQSIENANNMKNIQIMKNKKKNKDNNKNNHRDSKKDNKKDNTDNNKNNTKNKNSKDNSKNTNTDTNTNKQQRRTTRRTHRGGSFTSADDTGSHAALDSCTRGAKAVDLKRQ